MVSSAIYSHRGPLIRSMLQRDLLLKAWSRWSTVIKPRQTEVQWLTPEMAQSRKSSTMPAPKRSHRLSSSAMWLTIKNRSIRWWMAAQSSSKPKKARKRAKLTWGLPAQLRLRKRPNWANPVLTVGKCGVAMKIRRLWARVQRWWRSISMRKR